MLARSLHLTLHFAHVGLNPQDCEGDQDVFRRQRAQHGRRAVEHVAAEHVLDVLPGRRAARPKVREQPLG